MIFDSSSSESFGEEDDLRKMVEAAEEEGDVGFFYSKELLGNFWNFRVQHMISITAYDILYVYFFVN